MKINLILILFGLIFISAVSNESITNRSTEQIIISGDDVKLITSKITYNYKMGYRVTNSFTQSKIQVSMSHTELQKAEIVVIMER